MVSEAKVRSFLHLLAGAGAPVAPPAASPALDAIAPAPRTALLAMASAPQIADDILKWAHGGGVQAFGLGEKETAGVYLDDISLKIYVEKKLPKSRIDEPVPKRVSIGDLKNIETDVVEIGKLSLHGNTQRVRPAPPGFSIGRANDPPSTSTFGLVVRKRGQDKPWYLLSNNHGIGNSGMCAKGDVIIQPGAADLGSATKDKIGTLAEWVPFDFTPNSTQNTVDAAIAELEDGVATAAIALLGTPKGINTDLKRGVYVQKIGRSSNHSVARVTDVDLVANPYYPVPGGMKQIALRDQVLVTFYSSPGDSGSGIVDMDNNVVGLHVGGSDIVGFFSKISNVLEQLDLEVVTSADLANG